eukprot:4872175-Amphidinium_carterae.1
MSLALIVSSLSWTETDKICTCAVFLTTLSACISELGPSLCSMHALEKLVRLAVVACRFTCGERVGHRIPLKFCRPRKVGREGMRTV